MVISDHKPIESEAFRSTIRVFVKPISSDRHAVEWGLAVCVVVVNVVVNNTEYYVMMTIGSFSVLKSEKEKK